MAPEYVKNGHFSTKSDVYSFGVLVLEIVAGQKNSGFHNSVNLQNLVSIISDNSFFFFFFFICHIYDLCDKNEVELISLCLVPGMAALGQWNSTRPC